jgi:hypothetical protein
MRLRPPTIVVIALPSPAGIVGRDASFGWMASQDLNRENHTGVAVLDVSLLRH